MVALSASKLVWLAMFWISVTTSPIFCVPAASPSTTVLVRRASSAALLAISAERVTCWAMLLIDAVSSSVADATVSTLDEACVEAAAAAAVCRVVSAIAVAHRGRQALHFAGGYRNRLDDAADLALEAGGEFAPGGVAILLGALFGLERSPGARFGGARGFRLGRLLRGGLEQLRQLQSEPAQHAGLDQENDRVKHDAAEIRAAGIDRGGKYEVQHQMMQRDRDRADQDRTIVAIGDEACQATKKYMCMSACQACPRAGRYIETPPIRATAKISRVESPLPAMRHDSVAASASATMTWRASANRCRAPCRCNAIGTCSQSTASNALLVVSRKTLQIIAFDGHSQSP